MPLILLVCGSARDGSTNAAALRTAAALAGPELETLTFGGIGQLPLFNPDADAEGVVLDPRVADMRGELSRVDAVLICTPEYAGALPAALKNLLEWTIGAAGTYDKPVAWINIAGPASPSGAADAHDSLRTVLRYAGADIVEAACARVPITREMVGADGIVTDPDARAGIAAALHLLGDHARSRAADPDRAPRPPR